jgi:AcrR family transcriptional regulator
VSSTKTPETRRGYQSDLRAAQARLTRRAVVDAAAELFVRDGYSATTIDAVAEAAGVSRKTVFNAVGGKVALLKLAYDWALTGDDEPVPLPERAAVRRALASTDPAEAIGLWVAMMVEIGQRAAPIVGVLEAAADVEPQAAEMVAAGQAGRHTGARSLVDHVADLGGLAPGLSRERATDAFWAQTDPALYRRLVLDRGWTPAEFREWLTRATRAALLA